MKSEAAGSKSLSFSKVELAAGESVRIRRGGLFAYDDGLKVRWRLIDGFFGSLYFLLSGYGLPICHEVKNLTDNLCSLLVSFPQLGQLRAQKITVGEQGLVMAANSFFGFSAGIVISYKWLGFRSWIFEGRLFFVHAYGKGLVWYGGHGDFSTQTVISKISVELAYLIAYQPHLKIKVSHGESITKTTKVKRNGIVELVGKGGVVLQTRDPLRLQDEFDSK